MSNMFVSFYAYTVTGKGFHGNMEITSGDISGMDDILSLERHIVVELNVQRMQINTPLDRPPSIKDVTILNWRRFNT